MFNTIDLDYNFVFIINEIQQQKHNTKKSRLNTAETSTF